MHSSSHPHHEMKGRKCLELPQSRLIHHFPQRTILQTTFCIFSYKIYINLTVKQPLQLFHIHLQKLLPKKTHSKTSLKTEEFTKTYKIVKKHITTLYQYSKDTKLQVHFKLLENQLNKKNYFHNFAVTFASHFIFRQYFLLCESSEKLLKNSTLKTSFAFSHWSAQKTSTIIVDTKKRLELKGKKGKYWFAYSSNTSFTRKIQ